MNSNILELPNGLPRPVDDGAASHLEGAMLPDLTLPSTDGKAVSLGPVRGRFVLYVYPMTGRPNVPLPDGWNAIAGARGCTPQACSFRDHHAELSALASSVYGLSAQSTDYQREAHERLLLSFDLLSDSTLALKRLLHLPTFMAGGMELYKRLT